MKFPNIKTYSLLTVLLLLFQTICNAQNIDFNWAVPMLGTSTNYVNSVTSDINGNVYSIGIFEGTVDFDPDSNNQYNLTSVGEKDIFIQKLNAFGEFVWAKQIGSSNEDFGNDIAVDNNGNVYITGSFSDSADFAIGSPSHILNSINGAIFIQKLDSNGNLDWVKQLGVSNYLASFARSIVLDNDNNVYVTGRCSSYNDSLDFDPGIGEYFLDLDNTTNCFIEKLDSEGNFIWAKLISSAQGGIEGFDIQTDDNNNIYIRGLVNPHSVLNDSIDFDPNDGVHHLYFLGSNNPFVQKLNSDGEFVWVKQYTEDTPINSMTVTPYGNVYTVGSFKNSVNFEQHTLTSIGEEDAFIVKHTSSGHISWISQYGSNSYSYAWAVANSIDCDITGNIYVDIRFIGTIDFDISPNTYNLNYVDGRNALIKLNSTGNIIWGQQFEYNIVNDGIHISNNFDILTAGHISSSPKDFDPSSNEYFLQGIGYWNGFVCKLNQCMSFGIDTRTECAPYEWLNGNVYNSDNSSAAYTIIDGANSPNCDSVVLLNLTTEHVSDISVTTNNGTLTANLDNVTYQWLDCDDNYYAMNENDQDFYTPSEGSFAVEITENGCVDTSDCYLLNELRVIDIANKTLSYYIYYNSSTNNYVVMFNSEVDELKLNIFNAQGRCISSNAYQNTKVINQNINAQAGVYYFELITKVSRSTSSIVKY